MWDFLWKCSVAELEREKGNMQIRNGLRGLIDPRAVAPSPGRAVASRGRSRCQGSGQCADDEVQRENDTGCSTCPPLSESPGQWGRHTSSFPRKSFRALPPFRTCLRRTTFCRSVSRRARETDGVEALHGSVRLWKLAGVVPSLLLGCCCKYRLYRSRMWSTCIL